MNKKYEKIWFIVVSCYLVLNDLSPGGFFLIGTCLVILATFLYGCASLFTTSKQK